MAELIPIPRYYRVFLWGGSSLAMPSQQDLVDVWQKAVAERLKDNKWGTLVEFKGVGDGRSAMRVAIQCAAIQGVFLTDEVVKIEE